MIRQMLLLTLVFLFLAVPAVGFAQDDEKMDPFLQSDLKVLTGDVQRPNGIYWHDGYLYTGCAGDWTLYRLDAETGSTITYIFGIKDAHTLYVEDSEDSEDAVVWAVDFQDNQLVRVSHETGLVQIQADMAAPWGIAPSAWDDTFFITEWGSDNLINMTREGESAVAASGLDDPSGLVVTQEGIYVANNGSARRAVEYLPVDEENAIGDPQPLVSGLQNVTNLVLAPDNMLYIAYALGTRGVVGRVDPAECLEQGSCTNVDVELVVWTELPAPLAGLTITPQMRLFVHTQYGTEIYWLDLPSEDVTYQAQDVAELK